MSMWTCTAETVLRAVLVRKPIVLWKVAEVMWMSLDRDITI